MKYLTEDEIVQDIIKEADDSWTQVSKEDLLLGHFTTGRAIRNCYKLWDKENPHVVLNDVNHTNFPDQMSTRIMEKVWDKLNLHP